jgi:hypothetical protein
MNRYILELLKSGHVQRPSEKGVIVRVELEESAGIVRLAKLWRSEFLGFDWMQYPALSDIRKGEGVDVSLDTGNTLFQMVRSVRIGFAQGAPAYIHPTEHQLTIESGLTRSCLVWMVELPKEWLALRPLVDLMERLSLHHEVK